MIYRYNKKELRFVGVTKMYYFCSSLVVISLMALSSFFFYSYGMSRGFISVSPEEKIIILRNADAFSVDKFKGYLSELNVKFADVVYAQAQLETNGFKSKIFKENNNLFGMKQAMQRSSTNIGEQHGHAYYDSWRQSVLDYALYQCKYLSDVSTREQYLQYLKENYAEDPNYFNKLNKILNK
jgi:hypothetical protein